MRHPNLVQFHGITHDAARQTLSFVLSWADNGSLYDYMHVHNNTLDLVTSLRVVAEVAAGMAYLHANNVVHRDLKSPNVLLDDALCARITDFGLSTFAHDHRKTLSKVAGTPHWASPEQVLSKKLYADTDVFSFGVIVWECCSTAGHGTTASLHQMGRRSQTSSWYTRPASTCLSMTRSTGAC